MAIFPQINAAGFMMDRDGSRFGDTYDTAIAGTPVSKRTAWAWIGAGLDNFPEEPLGRWTFNYGTLSDAERTVLEDFFRDRRGRYEGFWLLDPYGNLVPTSEPSPGAADPFGGTRGTSASSFGATVVPSDANGFVFTASCWAFSNAGGNATIGVAGGSTIWTLPAGEWRRIWCTATMSGTGAVSMSVSGAANTLFGFQCVPLPGPAAYVRSPGRAGFREFVRFDQDLLQFRTLAKNQHSTTIQLVEHFG